MGSGLYVGRMHPGRSWSAPRTMVQSGIELPYKPPYRWDQVLGFLQGRTIDGVESIQDGVYARTALVTDRAGDLHRGWLQVENNANQNVLHLNLSDSLEPVQDLVEAEIRRQFDLDNDPHVVHDHLAGLSEIHPSLPVLGTRVPGAFDPFEMAVRAVLGRQITVTFARKLANRITQLQEKCCHFLTASKTTSAGWEYFLPGRAPSHLWRKESIPGGWILSIQSIPMNSTGGYSVLRE